MKNKLFILSATSLIALLLLNQKLRAQDYCNNSGAPPIPYSDGWNFETYKPGWKLVFADEFNDGYLDETKWVVDNGPGASGIPPGSYYYVNNGCSSPCSLNCNTTAALLANYTNPFCERQYFESALGQYGNLNVDPASKTLKITAKYENPKITRGWWSGEVITQGSVEGPLNCDGTAYYDYSWSSGRIHSRELYGYGYYEIRAKAPLGQSFWLAYWLYNADPYNEIDIWESTGHAVGPFCNDQTTLGCDQISIGDGSDEIMNNVHADNPNYFQCSSAGSSYGCKAAIDPLKPNYDNFYTVGLLWTPEEIRWYINGYLGRIYKKADCGAFPTNPMFVILDLQIEGWSEDKFLPFKLDGSQNTASCGLSSCCNQPPSGTFEIDYFRYYQMECNQQNARVIDAASNQQVQDFCENQGYSDLNEYPRQVGDFNGDGKNDIIGFKDSYTSVAFSNYHDNIAEFSYTQAVPFLNNNFYNKNSPGWSSQDVHPRLIGDVNGDQHDDIVGFTDGGVKAASSSCNGNTAIFNIDHTPHWSIKFFGTDHGFASQETNPRFVSDIDGDGMADIIGFSDNDVYVALSTSTAAPANPSFSSEIIVLNNFFTTSGGYFNQTDFPRFLSDVNGDNLPDIVGFKDDGVYVSINTSIPGTASFTPPVNAIPFFGTNHGYAGKYNPRFVVDVNADGLADIVGIGPMFVDVSLSHCSGTTVTFDPNQIVFDLFTPYGDWGTTDIQPRFMADVNCDRKADIIGFWNDAVMVSLSRSDLTSANFANFQVVSQNFVLKDGWNGQLTDPRFITDITGECGEQILGFGRENVKAFTCLSSLCEDNQQSTCYIPPPLVEFTMVPQDNQFFPVEFWDMNGAGCEHNINVNGLTYHSEATTYTDGHGVYVWIKGYIKDPSYTGIRCYVYNNDESSSTYNLSNEGFAPNPNSICDHLNNFFDGSHNFFINPSNPTDKYFKPSVFISQNGYFEFKIPINSADYDPSAGCNNPVNYTMNKLKEWKLDLWLENNGVATANVKTINNLVCGHLYIIAGQSNATAIIPDDAAALAYETNIDVQSSIRVRSFMRTFNGQKQSIDNLPEQNWGGWQKSSVVWYSGGYSGVLGMNLQKLIIEEQHIPVGIIMEAFPATKIAEHLFTADLLQSTIDKGYNDYNIYRHMLKKLSDGGQRIECQYSVSGLSSHVNGFVWYQGEDNAYNDNDVCSYAENFKLLYSALKEDLHDKYLDDNNPNTLNKRGTKFYLCQLNTHNEFLDFKADGGARIREIQRQLAMKYHQAFISDPNNNVFDVGIASTLGNDASEKDFMHYTTKGYEKLAQKIYNQIKRDFYDPTIDEKYVNPPNLLKAYYDDVSAPTQIILEFDKKVRAQLSLGGYLLKDYFFDENGNKINISSITNNNTKKIILNLGPYQVQAPYTIPYKKITYLPSSEYDNGTTQGSNITYAGPWIMNNYSSSGYAPLAALSFWQVPIVNDNDHQGLTNWEDSWTNSNNSFIGRWKLNIDDKIIVGNFVPESTGNISDDLFLIGYGHSPNNASSDDQQDMALLQYDGSKNEWVEKWMNHKPKDGLGYWGPPQIYYYEDYYKIDYDDGTTPQRDKLLAVNHYSSKMALFHFNGSGWDFTDLSYSPLFTAADATGYYYKLDETIKLTIGNFIPTIAGDEILGIYKYPGTILPQTIKLFANVGGNWTLQWSNELCTQHEMFPYRSNLNKIDFQGDGKSDILGMDLSPNGWATTFNYDIVPGAPYVCHCPTEISHYNDYNFNWWWSTNGCTNTAGTMSFGSNGQNGAICGGWSYPPALTDKILIGNLDGNGTADDKDEIFFIQTGSNAQWATTFDYNDATSQWSWNWSANPDLNIFTINNWELASASKTNYYLLRIDNNKKYSILGIRENDCEGIMATIFNTNPYSGSNFKTGVNNHIDISDDLTVYPVPAYDKVYLKFQSAPNKKAEIQIWDLFGKLINKFEIENKNVENNFETVTLNTHAYSPGVYFVNIVSGNISLSSKFIVSK